MGPWLQQSPGAGGAEGPLLHLSALCRNAPWAAPVPISRALPSVLALTWGWRHWENKPRAWRGAAEPSPQAPTKNNSRAWADGQGGVHSLVGWEDHGTGELGAKLGYSKLLQETSPTMSWPQGAAEEGKGFRWDHWDLRLSPEPSLGNGDDDHVVSTWSRAEGQMPSGMRLPHSSAEPVVTWGHASFWSTQSGRGGRRPVAFHQAKAETHEHPSRAGSHAVAC